MLTHRSFESRTGRSLVFATVAAVALTTAGPSFAASPAASVQMASARGATDFSAARRHHHRHYRHYRHHGGGGAAAAAAFAGIMGTVGAIAASQARRDAYYDYGPGYYGPPPGYYYRGPRYPYYPY